MRTRGGCVIIWHRGVDSHAVIMAQKRGKKKRENTTKSDKKHSRGGVSIEEVWKRTQSRRAFNSPIPNEKIFGVRGGTHSPDLLIRGLYGPLLDLKNISLKKIVL